MRRQLLLPKREEGGHPEAWTERGAATRLVVSDSLLLSIRRPRFGRAGCAYKAIGTSRRGSRVRCRLVGRTNKIPPKPKSPVYHNRSQVDMTNRRLYEIRYEYLHADRFKLVLAYESVERLQLESAVISTLGYARFVLWNARVMIKACLFQSYYARSHYKSDRCVKAAPSLPTAINRAAINYTLADYKSRKRATA